MDIVIVDIKEKKFIALEFFMLKFLGTFCKFNILSQINKTMYQNISNLDDFAICFGTHLEERK